jgi:catechol 2,3-dioxygenase-like lactoylglutathione lyase family enzyme
MFDHVGIRVSDRAASEQFYDTVLPLVGLGKSYSEDDYAEWRDFAVEAFSAEQPVTRRLHIAFFVPERAEVDEFWRTGTDAGYRDDGRPGPRPQYSDDYYGAFLLDPDGNSIEAVHHGRTKERGAIDHPWLRVADLDAAGSFYETIAPFSGFREKLARPERRTFTFEDASGSFTLVPGEPSVDVHLAFPATANATVDEFHRTALAAGYRDHGRPGERPQYHAGYYGAFVLDPDGNNIEVVNHNR